jgi:hypothetical protein
MIAQSETIGALAAALAKAQGEIENATKNAKNPHFKSNYADLAEILNTARPVLARHGIAVVQSPSYEQGEVQLATLLLHSSGEWIRGISAAPATKQDPQGVGSAVTYLRRYSLAAFVGIAQEDDDGNAASATRQRREEPSPFTPPDIPELDRCTAGQAQLIDKMVRSHVITADERTPILDRLSRGTMSKDKAAACIDWLTKEIPARKELEKSDAAEAGELPLDDTPKKRNRSPQAAGA